MEDAPTAGDGLLAHDWLGACRRAAEGLRAVLREHPTSTQRIVETGERGEGGDLTLVIDALAETAVFDELERLHGEGARFTAVSEERGLVDFGDPDVLVVIDPIDGSMNAKRGLTHHALSVAVADGPTMADVVFGYVYDLGPGEEWRAVRGGGAFLNDAPLDDPMPERRRKDGKLELLAIESADPRWLAVSSDALVGVTGRVRAMGSIAISLCQVAATRVDGMATLANCRAVDAAAAQLIVRETGGFVAFTEMEEPLGAPLDLEPHSPVVAARSETALAELAKVPTSEADRTRA
ncbi:MAG: monophosphatase [Solirubrobacteraceae bacterium]|nr:monophosphatase [Solirubrobacteraceae bacterium]